MRIGLRSLAAFAVLTVASYAANPLDHYLIYSGKASSTVVSTPLGQLGVFSGNNESTGAVGMVSPVLAGKHKDKLAFHGTINGAPDPDPNGIGWGLVKKALNTGGTLDQMVFVAAGIDDADSHLFGMGVACDPAGVAVTDITTSLNALGVVQMQVEYSVTHGYTPAKTGKSHLQEIKELTDALTEYKSSLVESGIVTAKTFDDFIKKLTTKKKKKKKIKKLLKLLLAGLEQCNLLQ